MNIQKKTFNHWTIYQETSGVLYYYSEFSFRHSRISKFQVNSRQKNGFPSQTHR